FFHCIFLSCIFPLISEIPQSDATEVHVLDSRNKLCLYANLMVTFNVTFEAAASMTRTVQFGLPSKVDSSKSSCGNNTSLLKLHFGNGHSWGMLFKKANQVYKAESILFTYNLKDKNLFQNSAEGKLSFNHLMSEVSVDTYYRCRSELVLSVGNVTQTMWNVSLQAFVNGNRSDKGTECEADVRTSPSPTTMTEVTALLTTPGSMPSPSLAVGNYSVSGGVNSTICLLATMGLQIQYKDQSVNLDPSRTRATGSCGFNKTEVSLLLSFGKGSIEFTFLEVKQWRRRKISPACCKWMVFHTGAANLSLWTASVGMSFMCKKELTLNMTNSLSLHTVNLHVQPFAVQNGAFAAALDCSMDDTSMLIPVIVGAILGGLIFILIVAFLIGGKKSSPGYQTL
uniref:Lysosomal associated membrane protein 2 n=1 Tax=Scleropages formosus TaxID=113540 RepID=A0A8C9V228_SCLFO